ncbi:class F sortase [Bailinhaonella thermotolerans]|uniref:Class F sortase n=2 Tax=Bailinhaonella thermotolerans TaxID=1070861 RepID=A0A3A4A933_9ACTN|nr:class F sortase [Bailinhaonella thermotolerans]
MLACAFLATGGTLGALVYAPEKAGGSVSVYAGTGDAAGSGRGGFSVSRGDAQPGTPPGARPMARSKPVSVKIAKIGVGAPVDPVGINANGIIEAPPIENPNLIGWYKHGPTPGEKGPAIILGHVDTYTGPAVFAELATLKKGDRIEVSRADGSVAVFAVERVEHVSKKRFPTASVYGNLDHAGLRLITCGGTFDREARSYTENAIVYARLVASRPGRDASALTMSFLKDR